MKIEELELQFEKGLSELRSIQHQSLIESLRPLVPDGYKARVHLHGEKGRKKRKDAPANSWSPDSGEIRISFEPEVCEQPPTQLPKPDTRPPHVEAEPSAIQSAPDRLADLIRAVDQAEMRPGYDFVALKWFRDVFLPGQGYDWTMSDSTRQAVLRDAIERRLILTSKVPNPKSPQFPVTAIRLNRLHKDNQAILNAGQVSNSSFYPVEMRGESLSATILRERR